MSETSPTATDYRAYGPLYRGWARALSLVMALTLAGILMIAPQLLVTRLHHGYLMLGMWGISAGFIHGVGYVPVLRLWRIAFGPWLAWPLMVLLVLTC